MNVVEIINEAIASGRTRFAFELLPPLKGDGMQKIFAAVEPLMALDPAYVNITFHREGIKETEREDGSVEWHVVRRRPGTVGISAAIMSTMDSLINTGAMTLVMDLLPGSYDEKTRLRLSRLATLVIVAVGILISLRIRSIFEITWIASDIITTGVFVPLVLAFFWRRGTSRGALCSMLCGLAYCLYNLAIFLGMPLPAFWEQQSALQVILGVCLSLLVFTVTSLLDEPEYHKADAFLARTRQQAC